jgi:hypothetical protein
MCSRNEYIEGSTVDNSEWTRGELVLEEYNPT